MSPLHWTTKSLRTIAREPSDAGHKADPNGPNRRGIPARPDGVTVHHWLMPLEDWDPDQGMVSRAFNDWESNAEELRGFFEHATKGSQAGFDSHWEAAGRAVAGTEHDQYDVFEHYAPILPRDFAWLLRASAIKDAVGAFDAYLEAAVDEARRGIHLSPLAGPKGRTPPWPDVVKAYNGLGVYQQAQPDGQAFTPSTVEGAEVLYARTLRHVLTHRRGEVRTSEDRTILANLVVPDSDIVELTDELVTTILDHLDTAARALDPLVWFLAWNKRTRARVVFARQAKTATAA